MKLFTKYSRINLLITVAIFILASIAYAFLLRYVMIEFVNDNLKIEQREIETFVSRYNKLPEIIHVQEQEVSYAPVAGPMPKHKFTSIRLWEPDEKKLELFRQITFTVQVSGQWYLAKVAISMEDMGDMIRLILVITIVTILLILMMTALINRVVLKHLWKPFYETLATINNFQLGNKNKIQLSQTNIDEFDLMNKTLDESLNKAENDYLLLKEFTANASHELQTPLAIVRSKMDILIQDENLSESQSKAAQSAYDAIQRMAKLNQSLLLLAKIENKQFEDVAIINLKEKIKTKLDDFFELWQSKHLTIKKDLSDCEIQMNPLLIEIMLNNLLSNATKHNIQDGQISITLTAKKLIIANTNDAPELDEKQLFTRFYKNSVTSDNGLGLCIAKQICDLNGFVLSYHYQNYQHTFSIDF
ncbi:sensor histidine kinase [Pinibacter soli]|uniref:histidine kinase n=1 Tax=Pinibacter soli TaxID=3044211 RepID=A0ABT6RD06_9BACT|nr:HAMP domain-containing sensor histidine kinase [Pinibacter soli]MDI3319754.1 HAMP domain-containing sensor histidine kinase [Pinibacter soli]